MPRFKDRPLEWIDVSPRFEACPTSDHAHKAIGFIQRLQAEGRQLLEDGSVQADRWNQGCLDLQNHIRALGRADRPDLPTALREFFHSFEHATGRMYQMMHGIPGIAEDRTQLRQFFNWFDMVYRHSTYAITASYCPNKNPPSTLRTTINLTTGEVTQEGERGEAKVPKKYRHATDKVR